MLKKIKSHTSVFFKLLKTDLLIFSKSMISGWIDTSIWVIVLLVIFTYIFPQLGMRKDFGAFFLVGGIASCCIFEIFSSAVAVISDLNNKQKISYRLTLPISSSLIFTGIAIFNACKSTFLSIIILPLGKLILGNKLNFTNLSIIKFVLMFFSINIFVGFFSLFMTSITDKVENIRSIWVRIIFPLWFLGGAEFPWQAIYSISPKIAYSCLFNPLLYPMEGIRAAVLGQAGFINFWYCFAMIWTSCIIFGWIGISRMKKRLDVV